MNEMWKLYRTVVRFMHLSHRERMSACLKLAWKNIKFRASHTVKAKTVVKAVETVKTIGAYVVPDWMMHEKALFGVRSSIIKDSDITTTTHKAFKAFGEWFPKSVCDRIEVAM